VETQVLSGTELIGDLSGVLAIGPKKLLTHSLTHSLVQGVSSFVWQFIIELVVIS